MTQHEINRVVSTGKVLWEALTEEERANYKYSEGLIGFVEIVMEALHLDPETLTEDEFDTIYDRLFTQERVLTPLGKLFNRVGRLPGNIPFCTVLYNFLDELYTIEQRDDESPILITAAGLRLCAYSDYVIVQDDNTDEFLCKIDVRFD